MVNDTVHFIASAASHSQTAPSPPAGWGHRLLLSHDLAAYLAFWDSWETTKHSDWLHLEEDYTFIHRRVLPLLEERGLSRADIDRLLTGNPCAFFEGV